MFSRIKGWLVDTTPYPGDIYEDCAYHPVLCLERDGDDVAGVSLFDLSQPRSCSVRHCKPRVMKLDEVHLRVDQRHLWLAAERAWHRGNEHAYSELLAQS